MIGLVTRKVTNPYPGLRSFRAEEADLFFGREEQVDKLLEKLQQSHFVAVVGSSGCGKSSLVKAGLIPALKAGFLAESGSKWRIAEMRPGEKPFRHLAHALGQAFPQSDTPPEHLTAELKRGPKGLIEVLKGEELKYKENFILIVDQFEEIFRFRQNNNINEATAFVSLLIASASQRDVPLHIVITMRSDFLGDCSLFLDLPELLNENQFLTPRLTREQCQEAIQGPAMVCEGKLDPQLVNTLLNDMGADHDQLPLLQHALMRMWNVADPAVQLQNNSLHVKSDVSAPALEAGYILDINDYNAIGKLSNALSLHADQVYASLTEKQKKVAELLFKRLTEFNVEQKSIRRPSSIQEIADIATVSPHEVIAVANSFRTSGCNFLMPPPEVELTAESYLDISHESIMRQWALLGAWMKEEQDAARTYKWLSDSVNENRERLRGLDLKNALDWQQKYKPNEAWASRYSKDYQQVENYIAASKRKRKVKIVINYIYLTILMILAGTLGATAYLQREAKHKDYLAQEINLEKEKLAQQFIQDLNHDLTVAKKKLQKVSNARLEDQALTSALRYNALKEKDLAEERRLKLDLLNLRLSKQRLENEAQLQAAQEELQVARKEANIARIKELSFYRSLNTEAQKSLENTLLPLISKDDKTEYNNVVKLIGAAVEAKNAAAEDPALSLRMAKKVWMDNESYDKYKIPILDSIVSSIINDNIFYKQEVVPVVVMPFHVSHFTLSNDNKNFVFNNYKNIITGQYQDDKILVHAKEYSTVESADDTSRPLSTSDNPIQLNVYSQTQRLAELNYFNNKVIGLEGNELFEWKNNKKISLKKLKELNYYTQARISPDRGFLLADTKTRDAKLWKISDGNLSLKEPAVLNNNNKSIRYLEFSPDSHKLLILYYNGEVRTWDTNGKFIARLEDTEAITAATFTNDNNHIITTSATGKAYVWRLSGSKVNAEPVILTSNSNSLNRIRSFTLSPDWKRIVLELQNNTFFVAERLDKDSVFSLGNYKGFDYDNLKTKRLGYYQNIVNAVFLNNNSIVSIGKDGNFYLWKLYPEFASLSDAFAAIEIPDLNFEEKLKSGLVGYGEVLLSSSDNELYTAAQFYYNLANGTKIDLARRLEYLNMAKSLYQKLETISTNDKKVFYLGKVVIINESLNKLEKDSGGRNYQEWVNRLVENVSCDINRLKVYPKDSLLIKSLSRNYGNLAFNQLFIHDNKGAIASSMEGLRLFPKNDWIYTNLALGYLLNGEYVKAADIYKSYQGKMYANKTKHFKVAFMEDFNDLEMAGIISEDNAEVYNKVKQIKKDILGVIQ